MKKAFLTIVAFATSLLVAAQHKIKFSYDAAGNRVAREAAVPKLKVAQGKAQAQSANERMPVSLEGVTHSYAQGVIRVNVPALPNGSSCELYVYSAAGALVFHGAAVVGTNEISITHCADGVYLVKAVAGENTSAWKIVKR